MLQRIDRATTNHKRPYGASIITEHKNNGFILIQRYDVRLNFAPEMEILVLCLKRSSPEKIAACLLRNFVDIELHPRPHWDGR